jgi:hypothetical protein
MNAVRVRVLDLAELKPDQWYFDMHKGSYKPPFPMAGILEQQNGLGEWVPVEVKPPPTTEKELTELMLP